MEHAYLISLSPSFQHSEYQLKVKTTIGRNPQQSQIVIQEPTVSRVHLCIDTIKNSNGEIHYELTDQNSSNGVFINEQKVGHKILENGDRIGLGQAEAHLLFQYSSARQQEYRFNINDKRYTIGRDISADISFCADPRVSIKHAEFYLKSNHLYVRDHKSLNGTWINGYRIKGSRKIELSDAVTIGSHELRFSFDSTHITANVSNQKHHVQIEGVDLNKIIKIGQQQKAIIQNLNVAIKGGEFIGILGPSGAGKTNLLKTLAGQQPPTSGCVLYNQTPLYRHPLLFQNSTAYVPQDDIIHSDLKVKRCLEYAAKLRLPADVSDQERQNLIQTNLANLGLDHVSDNRIDELSGGQRKRVSIGAELITRPAVLFLDEPTSGLDPSTEERLMKLFKSMAEKGSTVLITTHILYNLSLLDKVIILSRGRLVYFGEPEGAMEFFSTTDKPLEKEVSIFDQLEAETTEAKELLDSNNKDSAQEQLARHYQQSYNDSTYHQKNISQKFSSFAALLSKSTSSEQDSVESADLLAQPLARRVNKFKFFSPRQCATMIRRLFEIKCSSPGRLLFYMLAPLIFALITATSGTQDILDSSQVDERRSSIDQIINGPVFSISEQIKLLFSKNGPEEVKPATDIVYSMMNEGINWYPIPISALIMLVMASLFTGTLMSCLEISTERPVFIREYMSGVGALEYLLSKLPFLMLITLIQVLFMLGLCLINSAFLIIDLLWTAVTLTLISWVAVAMGLFVSACDPSKGQFSVVIALIIVLPQLILSGALGPDFFLNMNLVSKQIAALLPAKWGLEMLITAANDIQNHQSLDWIPTFTKDVIGFNYGNSIYLKSSLILTGQFFFWLLACLAMLKYSVRLK